MRLQSEYRFFVSIFFIFSFARLRFFMSFISELLSSSFLIIAILIENCEYYNEGINSIEIRSLNNNKQGFEKASNIDKNK